MKEAAVLAIVAALAYDSTSEEEKATEPLDATLSYLLDLSFGTPLTRKATASLILRLIPLLQQNLPVEATVDTLSLVSIPEGIKDAVTGKDTGSIESHSCGIPWLSPASTAIESTLPAGLFNSQ